MTKIEFKNLPDTSTPLSAENLNTMQDNIEDAIPTLDNAVSSSSTNGIENQAITNYVDGEISDTKDYVDTEVQDAKDYTDEKCTYSTDEVVVGTWIDGRPLYRKVVQFTTASGGDTTVDLSSLNIRKVVKIDGVVGSDSDAKPINFYYEGYYISPRYANNTMYIASSTAYGNTPACLVLEYTKTTD